MSIAEPRIYSVSKINGYIRNVLENDFVLNSVWVTGEISNFKYHSSGNMFFSLKDNDSTLSCIMFRGDAAALPFMPENGILVVVCGYISVYEKSGQYNLVAQLMRPEGIGALTLAFEQLKEKLLAEGLFDADYKREINTHPENIAVVTSPTGAAVRDIIKIAGERNKNVSITVIPVLVQGENAASSIAEGIRLANRLGIADTIIVGRGGGSIEDLWAFNDERVARAVFASEIPVISAVGHETDFTITDFVADVRASTPSNAAEIAVNDVYSDRKRAEQLKARLKTIAMSRIMSLYGKYELLLQKRNFSKPWTIFDEKRRILEDSDGRLRTAMERSNIEYTQRLRSATEKLDALSPLKVLKRGYSFTENEEGKVVASVNDVYTEGRIKITLKDGILSAIVKDRVIFDGKKKDEL